MITMDAILLGGGVGRRFSENSDPEGARPKQFQIIAGLPVFIHALKSFLQIPGLRYVWLTTPRHYYDLTLATMADYLSTEELASVRPLVGGETRQASSRLALEAIAQAEVVPERVLVHDACRPFLSPNFLTSIKEKLLDRSYGAWIPVVPLVETLKKVHNSQVVETVDRSMFYRVQTPQIFEFSVIRALAQKNQSEQGVEFTDDASLCEYYGIPVGTFEGDVRNIKLTYPFEMQTLSAILSEIKNTPEEI